MKILKFLLFLIIGLVLLFLLIGLLKPSVSYGHEIEVTKSVKEAWAVAQDDTKYTQWLEGYKSMELISGEKGKAGSKYKVIVNPGEGQPDFEMIETVVAINEYENVDLHFASDFMDFEQTISFSEKGSGSMVKTDSKVIGKNIMSRAMFALMEMLGGAFTKQETKNIDKLKELIDQNTTDYYPAPILENLTPAEQE